MKNIVFIAFSVVILAGIWLFYMPQNASSAVPVTTCVWPHPCLNK